MFTFFNRLSIRTKLYLIVVVSAVACVSLMLQSLSRERAAWKERIEKKGVKVNAFLANISATPIQTGDYVSIIDYVKDLKEDDDGIAYVIVCKGDDVVITRDEARIRASLPDSRDIKTIRADVTFYGERIGTIETGISLEKMNRAMEASTTEAALLLVMQGVALAILVLLVRGIIKPITSLTREVTAIRSSTLGQQIHIAAKDEIGKLASAFNTMSVRLRQSHESLEGKVGERTAELAKANTELESKHQQLLSMFESMDEVVYVADRDTHELLYMNSAARAQWGDAVGKKCYRVLQNRDSPCPFCTNDRIFGESSRTPYVWELQNKVNHRWYRCNDRAIPWPDGRMVRFELAVDVTERKRAEEELQEERNRLQSTVDAIDAMEDGLTIQDTEYNIVFQNQVFKKMVGGLGSKCYEVYEGRDRICEGCPVELAFRDGQSHTSERKIMPAGETGYWETTANPIRNAAGEIVACLEIARNVTERKLAEEHVAQAHRSAAVEVHKLRSMIEGMDEGIVVADADNIITEVNEWFLEKVGLGRDDIIGKSLWEFHADTEGTARLRAALEAFRSGQRREKFVVNRELLGMQLSLRVQPIVESEHYQGVILNVINVTDLVKARKAAEAATQVKSEFLANMSHEIRTPMTAILGFADVLLEHGSLDNAPPERVEAAETIKRNGQYLLRLINDILDLSKIEAGKVVIERLRCSPSQIVAEVASLVRVRADAKGLAFNTEYVGAVPETIQTDPTRLRQILINVIGNAIKFTEVGGVRLITRLVDDGTEPLIRFDVVDTGLGMGGEQVAKLFQPFTQGDASTTRKFGGTGLGLTISKRLAGMLGGDIAVLDTAEGIGTRFRVTVATGPLEGVRMIEDPVFATTATTEATKTTTGADQPTLDGYRILLAEDGPDNQRLIGHVLRKAGAQVTVVENGKLAAEAALAVGDPGAPGFDVILMDMQMPVMDGYEATGLLRQKGYSGPILALTAHAMAGDRDKCLQAGCDDYASKPIDRKKLIKTIRQHLDSRVVAGNSA